MAIQEWIFDHFSAATILAIALALPLLAMAVAGYFVKDLLPVTAQVTGRAMDWRRGFLILPVALVAYWDQRVAMLVLPFALLRAANIYDRVGVMRTLGPDRYRELLQIAVTDAPSSQNVLTVWIAASMIMLAGAVLWLFSEGTRSWTFWFAIGLMLTGLLHGVERMKRIRQLKTGQVRVGSTPVA